MKKELLAHYQSLVLFLGKTLGPSYEIVLHEVIGEKLKMIAIANGEISNRILGNPLSEETLELLKNKTRHGENNMINHTVLLKNGKKIRSSSILIRDSKKVIGVLCINFDDSCFHEIHCQLLRTIHPDLFVQNYLSDISYNILLDELKSQKKEETQDNTIEMMMEKIFQEVSQELHFPLIRPNKKEKEKIVYELEKKRDIPTKRSDCIYSKKAILFYNKYLSLFKKNTGRVTCTFPVFL